MSASVPTSTPSTLRGWRVAAIAGVAILAVAAGVAAGGFLLTSRPAGVGGAAAWVPSDAAFYLELRVEPSETQDAALREILARFPAIEELDLERPLTEQLGEHLDQMLAEEGAEVSWSEDVEPWFDGRVAIAVPELPAGVMAPTMDAMTAADAPDVVMLVGVTDRAAAEHSIDRIIAEAEMREPMSFSETEHAGVTIHVAEGDEGAWALTDDQLLLGASADAIRGAIDAHEDAGTTLAEADHVADLAAQLPSDWLAFGVYDFTDAVSASFDAAAEASPAISEAFRDLMDGQPLRGAMAMSAEGDRLAFESVSAAPTGDLAAVNADRGLAAEVPADALYYAEGGNIGRSLQAVIGPMKEAISASPEGAEQLRTFEAAIGVDAEELVSWIGDGAMAVGWDGAEAYAGMVLVPTDVDAASRRLGQLTTFASLGAMDPEAGITVEESTVAGADVTTIRWADPGSQELGELGPSAVSVQYTVTDDRAVIGFGEQFVGRVLELEAADSLASQARYTDAVAALGGASNAGVTWLDITGVRAAVEAAMGPMLDAADPEGTYETEIAPWLAPLDRLVSVVRVEGDLLVQQGALLVE
ncbi:MAG TPA: DUF3352 domain-containing protein [Candidatus Limnocylindria bacterium]|nr:DUF3352 domain-containing protein [Candidatus Limnocylindria bacterium]